MSYFLGDTIVWNMPWNSIPDSVSPNNVAEDEAPTSESADGAEKGELALPLMASLDLAAAHVADVGLEPNGMTGSLEMDPVWVKRSKLAHEFGIRKMHFVPVAGAVLLPLPLPLPLLLFWCLLELVCYLQYLMLF
jgi:hypothetical protein